MVTPNETQPSLAKVLGVEKLYFKREDLHQFGSHKGRSIGKMIELYQAQGFKHFAISSSGNAAIAAALFITEHNQQNSEMIKLNIFVGKKINQEKFEMLQGFSNKYITVEKTERPLQKLFQLLKTPFVKSLRQSTDDLSLVGYENLAKELSLIPNLKAVFIPTSSGTLAQALGETFLKLGLKIQIHVVQTSFCHPISKEFDQNIIIEPSIADAIVDITAHRKEKVTEIIKKTKGFGWIVGDTEIKYAQKLVLEIGRLDLSPNSSLAVAGLRRAIEKNYSWDGAVACIITGK